MSTLGFNDTAYCDATSDLTNIMGLAVLAGPTDRYLMHGGHAPSREARARRRGREHVRRPRGLTALARRIAHTLVGGGPRSAGRGARWCAPLTKPPGERAIEPQGIPLFAFVKVEQVWPSAEKATQSVV